MLKMSGYIAPVLMAFLALSATTAPAAEGVSASLTRNHVTWEILPGFVHPSPRLWTNNIVDTHRLSDPRYSLKPVGKKVYENAGIEEPVVVDNLFRLRF